MPQAQKIQELPKKQTIPALAMQALDDSDGNRANAIQLLEDRIRGNGRLYKRFADELISRAIKYEIKQASGRVRSNLKTESRQRTAVLKKGQSGEHLQKPEHFNAMLDTHKRMGIQQSLMDYPLSRNGLKLRDATGADLRYERALHFKQGTAMLNLSKWYDLMCKKVGVKQYVKQKLSDILIDAMLDDADIDVDELWKAVTK